MEANAAGLYQTSSEAVIIISWARGLMSGHVYALHQSWGRRGGACSILFIYANKWFQYNQNAHFNSQYIIRHTNVEKAFTTMPA